MAVISAIVLNDGAATPVAHTFTPIGVQDAIAKWQDKSGGISVGYPSISYSLRLPSKSSRTNRITAKVVFPVLETISNTAASGIVPAPQKAFDLIANIEFVLPERASTANRKDLLAFARNYLASAVFTTGVQDLDAVWG